MHLLGFFRKPSKQVAPLSPPPQRGMKRYSSMDNISSNRTPLKTQNMEKKSLKQRFFSFFKKNVKPQPLSSQNIPKHEEHPYNDCLKVFLAKNTSMQDKFLTLIKTTTLTKDLTLHTTSWNNMTDEDKQFAVLSTLSETLSSQPEACQEFVSSQEYADMKASLQQEKEHLATEANYRSPLHEVSQEQIEKMMLFCHTLEKVFPQAEKATPSENHAPANNALYKALSHLAFPYIQNKGSLKDTSCATILSENAQNALAEKASESLDNYVKDALSKDSLTNEEHINALRDASSSLLALRQHLQKENKLNVDAIIEESINKSITDYVETNEQKLDSINDLAFKLRVNALQNTLTKVSNDAEPSQEQYHQQTQEILSALKGYTRNDNAFPPLSENDAIEPKTYALLNRPPRTQGAMIGEIIAHQKDFASNKIYSFLKQEAFSLPNDKLFYKAAKTLSPPPSSVSVAEKHEQDGSTILEFTGEFSYSNLRGYSEKPLSCDPKDTCLRFQASLNITPDGQCTFEKFSYDNTIHILPESVDGKHVYLDANAVAYEKTMSSGTQQQKKAMGLVETFSIPPNDVDINDLLITLNHYETHAFEDETEAHVANKDDFCRNLMWQQGKEKAEIIKENLERCLPFYQDAKEHEHKKIEKTEKKSLLLKMKKSETMTYNSQSDLKEVSPEFWKNQNTPICKAFEKIRDMLPLKGSAPQGNTIWENTEKQEFQHAYLDQMQGKNIYFKNTKMKKSISGVFGDALQSTYKEKRTKQTSTDVISQQFKKDIGRTNYKITLGNETMVSMSNGQNTFPNAETFISRFTDAIRQHVGKYNSSATDENKNDIIRSVTESCTQDYAVDIAIMIANEGMSTPECVTSYDQLINRDPLSFVITSDLRGNILITAECKYFIKAIQEDEKQDKRARYDLNRSSVIYTSHIKIPIDGSKWILEDIHYQESLFEKEPPRPHKTLSRTSDVSKISDVNKGTPKKKLIRKPNVFSNPLSDI